MLASLSARWARAARELTRLESWRRRRGRGDERGRREPGELPLDEYWQLR
jgi:hypothetical protein